jgi:lactobin A/cerein 7B family class IIb bacteriocin
MNEFSAVSAEELKQVDGGIVPVIAAGVVLLAGCIDSTDDIEDREPLPGFNKFLDNVANISRQGR